MRLIKGYIALFYSTLGFKKFWQKKFNEAILLYKKARKHNADLEEENNYNSFIGRSYFALGNYQEAVKYLSQPYEHFKKKEFIAENEYMYTLMQETIKALSHSLDKTGNINQSRKVERKIETVVYRKKGTSVTSANK